LKLSSHFFIRRSGELWQFVPVHHRAWHAGQSQFQGRSQCNDFSIGVELEGTDDLPYTDPQYHALVQLTQSLMAHYPRITSDRIAGHSDIAPGRKTDPGPYFDWKRLKSALNEFSRQT
jgi:AmpD protein